MREELDLARRLGAFDPLFNSARIASIAHWGPGLSAAVAAAAVRFPSRVAISDDHRDLTYRSLSARATNLAAELRKRAGAGDGATIGILARNHAGFLVAHIAAERAGVDMVLLSTALPAPELANILARDDIRVLIADEEFEPVIADSGASIDVIWADTRGPRSLADLSAVNRLCAPPRRRSRLVLLTSGTTGPPKGARRPNRAPRASELGLFSRIPYRTGDVYYVVPPLFHAWGLSQATVALSTASTLVLRRRFDAGQTIDLMTQRQLDVFAVVPLMLRRILHDRPILPDEIHRPRLVLSSGNVLQGALAAQWMDRFGDHLYNLYGSTEAAIGTIASPDQLRASPGTVGSPPRGVTLSILDPEGMPQPVGESGRVHLSSSMQFSGYTDGSGGERSGTMLATGDLGWVDEHGLLHVEGRANDMVVTGGENVYPSRVEEVLDQLPEVEMSAVVGVDDDEWGQRVVAFIVPRRGWTIDPDRIRAEASIHLPSFMVPRQVFTADALPMTTTGKVVRHKLAVLGDAARL